MVEKDKGGLAFVRTHHHDSVYQKFIRLCVSMAVLVLIGVPYSALAQTSLQSTNYVLDGVTFGSNFTLTSGQSTVPPEISAEGPSIVELTPTTAKISWKTDKKSSSTILYGTTASYGQETGNSELVTEHTITVFGLSAETTYHFKVRSVDAFGAASTSEDKTFTTPAEAGISSIKVSDVGYDKALVSWTTGLFTASRIEYGPTTRYGNTKESSSRSFLTNHTLQLTDLTPGTDYHFRIVAEDEDGNVTRSSDLIFTTIANPSFSSITVAETQTNSTIITWKTNVFTTGIVTYKSDKDEKNLTAGDTTLTTDHSVTLKNLFGLSSYSFTITATDGQGKTVTSGAQTFTTLTDATAPEIANLKVSVTRSGEELVLTLKADTNEPAQLSFLMNPKSDAENVTTVEGSKSYVTQHVIVASGLLPSTPYTLRAIAKDSFDNQSEQSINFVTPGLRKSVFQLILDSILKPFGWLSQVFGS